MFEDPIAPRPDPSAKKWRQPFKGGQPSYDKKKKLFPAGDYYGTGFKAKVGKLRDNGASNIPQKSMRKDPESLA